MSNENVLEQFRKDTASHVMEVVMDNGVYRHLRFRKPGTYCYGFDVMTWPDHLAITGDMGASVFSRLHDMLQFFRETPERHDRAGGLFINPGYWAEKLVANNGERLEFRPELFREYAKECFDEFVDSHHEEDAAKPYWSDRLWDQIEDEVLSISDDHEDLRMALNAMHEFEPNGGGGDDFRFHDAWEAASSMQQHTFHFTWRLYAIAHAVKEYDALKTQAVAA